METMRATWTDQRLDDLAARMERGFDRVDTDVRELRSEMNTRFDSMQQQMAGIQQSMVGMQRTMTTMLASLLTGLLVVIVGFVVTNLQG
jgi:hypothetical protein